MGAEILSLLARFLPIRIRIKVAGERRTSVLILDDRTFEECKSKVVEGWSWKRFKTEKWVVHFKNGEFITERLV